ncbi:M20/M25/M40 family metallo-hydrolase [Peribacillus sp. TH16]|uniref:M20 family metallopeptidase n=1 Tax=unclassified Peribacillus TaxID=2675266 RepID=UPI001911554E|nr:MULTISPECIES: M20/M25/M40 family metallo-hydrolase [unclassified Peribacillus]MBK5458349.1 M20/M25/M40 family metallo-hydrolase [Peribacillus sp. TH27]MBK5483135.1 M20/M25/M40 family metallo-hydrolase [Peribacillus sp. TH16]
MNKEVVPACDIKHKDSIEGLACELIRMEATTSERINASIGYCAEWLRQRGLTITLLENQGLMSLVCIVNEEREGPTIILNGHVDVVSAASEDFSPRIEERKLFGRGSYDMLGSVAAMMHAMVDLSKMDLLVKIMLCIVPDEERGGFDGTGFLVDQGYRGEIAICGEPTNYKIAVQAKGVLQLKMEVSGIAAHGSRPWLGENAILKAMKYCEAIEAIEQIQKTNLFFTRPSFNLSKIEAGKGINQVPDQCTFHLDIRYLPGEEVSEIIEQIQRAAPDANLEILAQGAPVLTDEGHPYVVQLKQVTEHFLNRKIEFFGQDGTADTRFYANYGIPAIEFGPVGAGHHGPEEYVEIESLYSFKEILKLFAINLVKMEE